MSAGVFVPGVCCAHEWVRSHVGEICAVCKATCQRDRDGKIVLYSAAPPTRMSQEKAAA